MTATRERDIIQAFMDLSNELVDGYDIVELLERLNTSCTELLDIASLALLLADRHGVLHLIAASSQRTHDLEVFQLQREEGPCLDSFRSGQPVAVPDLAEKRERWPNFAPAALALGSPRCRPPRCGCATTSSAWSVCSGPALGRSTPVTWLSLRPWCTWPASPSSTISPRPTVTSSTPSCRTP